MARKLPIPLIDHDGIRWGKDQFIPLEEIETFQNLYKPRSFWPFAWLVLWATSVWVCFQLSMPWMRFCVSSLGMVAYLLSVFGPGTRNHWQFLVNDQVLFEDDEFYEVNNLKFLLHDIMETKGRHFTFGINSPSRERGK